MKTTAVEVPPELVSVTEAEKSPARVYECVVVGVLVVLVEPSPNVHLKAAIVPKATVEAEASKVDALPTGPAVTLNFATGAWSGVIASGMGLRPTAIGVPATPVATVIRVTAFEPVSAT